MKAPCPRYFGCACSPLLVLPPPWVLDRCGTPSASTMTLSLHIGRGYVHEALRLILSSCCAIDVDLPLSLVGVSPGCRTGDFRVMFFEGVYNRIHTLARQQVGVMDLVRSPVRVHRKLVSRIVAAVVLWAGLTASTDAFVHRGCQLFSSM